MGAFNRLLAKETCAACEGAVTRAYQFKYGDKWQYDYRLGDLIRWGGNDEGTPGQAHVETLGYPESCQLCGWSEDADYTLTLQYDRIVAVHGPTTVYGPPSWHLLVHRPFGWGIVIVADAESRDIPTATSAEPFTASRTALVVRVRHASDVEFDALDSDQEISQFAVVVKAEVGPRAAIPVDYECVLALPSGRLTIGDADEERILNIGRGEYRVQVALDDAAHAKSVQIWVSEHPLR